MFAAACRPLLRSLFTVTVLVSICPIFGLAAETKRPLTHQDFDGWRSIGATPVLSRDGQWLAYSFMPLEGDGEVVLRELTTSRELRVPVGALPAPPVTSSDANPERPAPRRDVGIMLTSDSRFAVATIFPTQAETQQARREKRKPEEMPREGLAIIALSTGNVVRVPSVKNMQVPARGGSWIAYLRDPVTEPKDQAEKPSDPATPPNGKKPREKKYGSDLVLRDLSAPAGSGEQVFANVLEYSFSRDGRTLLFAVSSRTDRENGVFAVTPGAATAPLVLASGPGRYVGLTWDREQTQATFASDRADPWAETPRFALYLWPRTADAASEIVSASTHGFPAGFGVSDETAPSFSFDGRKVFVPAVPLPLLIDERLETLPAEEKVLVDLWHWRDDFLPPMQKQRTDKERKRSFLGAFDLASHSYVQIADQTLRSVTFSDDGAHAFGQDDRPYRLRIDYDGIYQDLYLVDTTTGARRFIAPALGEKSGVRWSHNGRWLAFFHEKQWYRIDARDGSVKCLTSTLPVAFFDELTDLPQEPGAYGAAGWTRDGESLLVYDRYDIWQIFPDGRAAINLTVGAGRAARIQFRLQPIEPNEPEDAKRGIDLSGPVIMRGEDEATRDSGYFRAAFTRPSAPERLLWTNKNVRFVTRALDADVILLSESRFDEYPDLHVTGAAFSPSHKVTDGAAQMDPFLWGTAESLTYQNADGVTLPATLYKPANFDPAKKYPMIVYIYERLSQVVHTFYAPTPNTVINPSVYTSNGYLVLMPDIAYTVGYPGESAMKCVLPAVDAIVDRGYVDENALGLEGHSWGGYQTAYIITRSNRFRAAEAGAVVGNMTSAYSGIRWGSGTIRQYQYEREQSRIGHSLQDAPLLYVENSPVFGAARVQTPLLMLHNDQDDTVPWYQGIEFFLALRRQGKEVYFLNYNSEFHGLRRRADQKDFAKRMSQFFDHFLKGTPTPAWMEHGIPFAEREEEALRFRDTP
jgi:dipeptidyl aminopeptidase/acylaminoacyl peptidase